MLCINKLITVVVLLIAFLTTVPNESIMKEIGRRSDIFYDVTKTLVSREEANLRLEEPNNLDHTWDLQNKE